MPPNGLVGDLQNVTEALVPETPEDIAANNAAIVARSEAAYAAEEAAYEQEQQAEIEREYRQSAIGSRAIIVDALYPPLILTENIDNGIVFNYHMAPTSYQESFKSRWSSEDQAHGYLNPKFSYGGTEREVSLSFILPAMSVQQAINNLSQCSKLSRTVYGRYRQHGVSGENANTVRVFSGERKFTVDFGSLIRDEKGIISDFTFNVDPDAGVFDYEEGASADSETTHSQKGLLLPRQLSVSITIVFIHDNPLGFGGRNRIQGTGDLKWAENRDRDWPHGTGRIPVQEYMSEDTITDTEIAALDPEPMNSLLRSRGEGRVYEGPE